MPAGRFVFVHVYEASTHAPPAAVQAAAPERVSWNERTRRMAVAFPEDRPRPSTQVYLLAERRAALRRVGSRVHPIASMPYAVPLERPAPGLGGHLPPIPGPLEIASAAADGSVGFRFDGRDFALRPGEEARFGWYRDAAGAVRAFAGGPEWQAAIDRAVAERWPLTNVIIANLGLWDLEAVGP